MSKPNPSVVVGSHVDQAFSRTSHDALRLIRGLAGLHIASMDVVEVSPPYDCSELTALAGASIAQELLAAYASRFPVRSSEPVCD